MKFSCFIIFLFSLPIFAQENESDYKKWANKAKNCYRVNNDSTIFYAKKMQLTATNNCEYIKGVDTEVHSIYFKRNCKLTKEKCILILKELEDNKLNLEESCYIKTKSRILSRLMYAEKCLGNYITALNYIQKNEILYKKYQTYYKDEIYGLWCQSAQIYMLIGENEEAILLLKKSLDSIVVLTDSDKLAYASIHISLIGAYTSLFVKNNKKQYHLLDSARIHNKKYFEIGSSIKNQKIYTQKIFELKNGWIESLYNNHEKALSHLRKSRSVILTEEKYFTNQEIDFHMASNFSSLSNSDSTIFYSNQFLKKFIKHPYKKDYLVVP